jgi:hypothetical protein
MDALGLLLRRHGHGCKITPLPTVRLVRRRHTQRDRLPRVLRVPRPQSPEDTQQSDLAGVPHVAVHVDQQTRRRRLR